MTRFSDPKMKRRSPSFEKVETKVVMVPVLIEPDKLVTSSV